MTIAVGASYIWSVTNQTYTAADSPVLVELLDDNGCTYTVMLKIIQDNRLSIGDSAINEGSLLVNVYPAPFNQEINVHYEFGFDTDVSIQVIDMRGVILKNIKIRDYGSHSERRIKIDLRRLSDQILLVRVTTNKGSIGKKITPSNKR